MANSRIDATGINDDYPVAGIDNDSQGFRDNFNLIKTGLSDAKLDIEDLLSTSVLKSELLSASQVVDNNLNGNEIYNVLLRQVGYTVANIPPASGILNLAQGNYFKVQTITSGIALTFDNVEIDTLGHAVSIILELQSTATTSVSVTLPAATYTNITNVPTAGTGNVLTLYTAGTYIYRLTTTNNGGTWFIEQLFQPNKVVEQNNADNINVKTPISYFAPTTAWTMTLLDGNEGQQKQLVNIGTATATINVSNALWGSIITMPAGTGITLVFVNGKWACVGNHSTTLS